MSDSKQKSAAKFALAASLVMVLCGFVATIPGTDATGEDLTGFGEASEIVIAPGYSWSYTAEFAEDLRDGTVLSFQTNELGDTKATISGKTVSVKGITSDMAGKKYNIVLKAVHTPTAQTAYQWIRITVNAAMTLEHSQSVNQIIAGAEHTITLNAKGGIGNVTWSSTSVPPGMELAGNVVSGTPTKIGTNTFQVTGASDKGQSANIEITFTVFNKIVGGSDQVVNAANKYAASTAIAQTGTDLGVKWAVKSGTIPGGFSLAETTGVIFGTYTGETPVSAVIILEGTATIGPSQTTTKKVTINAEPTFAINGDSKVLTYKDNSDKSISLTASKSTSAITWTISPTVTGVSVGTDGKLTVKGTAAPTNGTEFTVTARTVYGQEQTKKVTVQVEDKLTITGDASLAGIVGKSKSTSVFDIKGGSGNTVTLDRNGISDTVLSYSDGKLTVQSPTIFDKKTVTITVRSAAGQTATHPVQVQVFSSLGFTNPPAAYGIFALAE